MEQYQPLRWVRVSTVAQNRQWNELINQYHYLGAPGLVGANLKYLVSGRAGELLGAVGWQSAVKDLGARDRVVGWTAAQRAQWLGQVVTGVRFLLVPWVRVPHLASVMLSENVSQELKEFAAIFGPAYGRVETRELGELYLRGLLSDTERKNMEAMALELRGAKSIRGLQRLLNEF